MRWALVLVVACSSAAPKPAPVGNRAPPLPAPPPSVSMIDQIVHAELEHAQRDPAWLPDAGLLAATGPLLVLRDVDIARLANGAVTSDPQQHIMPSALPTGSRTYALIAKDALQAEADRSGHEVMYIDFGVTFFEGESDVHIDFGVHTMLPSTTKGLILCCCGAIDLFANHDGQWTLTKRRAVVCS